MNKYNTVSNKPNSIVTNGSLITDKMIKLFKEYNVSVAVSADGPPELNVLRGQNPEDKTVTMNYNKLLFKNIQLLVKNDIRVSIMCVLHTENVGTDERLHKLTDWFEMLSAMGITGGRMNQLESNFPWTDQYELSNERILEVYKYLWRWNNENNLRYLPMREYTDNLLGFGNSPCIFGQCDWYQTNTSSILPDGTITNCDRTFGEGLHTISTGGRGERVKILEQTQCKDCRYWTVCYGGCPSESADGDWRNKTKFCEAVYGIYEFVENELKGIFPNIKLKVDSGYSEPFIAMVHAFNSRCSSWGNYTTRPKSNLGESQRLNDLVPKELLPPDLDPKLPWRYTTGGYHANEHTDGGEQE